MFVHFIAGWRLGTYFGSPTGEYKEFTAEFINEKTGGNHLVIHGVFHGGE